MRARECFFLWRILTSRSRSMLWKRTWNVTLVTRFLVDQQLWISMNSWNTKWYVFNAHGVALICQCWQCSSNFSTAATLSFHVKTVHEGQNIQCNICDNKMPAKGSLEAPLRSKHEEIELSCQMCEFKSVHGSSMIKIALMGISSLLQSMRIHKCLQLAIKATCLKKAQLRLGLFSMWYMQVWEI